MTADDSIRAMLGALPTPEFDGTPFTKPPALDQAKVAIVTTAALRRPSDPAWPVDDPGFRVLPSGARDLVLSHFSPNFDRSGLASDLNVVYPIDRLNELAAEGMIGQVAERHLSFHSIIMGTFTTMMMDTGPAAAHLLREDGVDVVLLTPI